MDDEYKDILSRLAANEQEHKSYNRRLEAHDKALEQITETQIQLANLTNAVNNLATGVREMKSVVQSMDNRVSAIEKEPGEKWKKVTWEIIKAVVLAIAAYALGHFTKGA